eukprot:TRINITY_DN14085_c0_g1_i1.p1 TRINITY_DN14085_c0_g1~~TRINITY_DN14085_c0_g1_i1.p1  ORF type:complete len:919 (-),score=243.39 TRINITY_DN14085_c0_g1_i1:310-3066(-)
MEVSREAAGIGAVGGAADLAHFGFEYNRAAFSYDQTLRWSRFNTGRKFAMSQMDMFREDVSDLASVAMVKLHVYGPIMTMSIGYCVTVFVEGRSGLKFPAPPTFISGLYLQSLGVAFGFFTLAVWMVFHASLRAQVAAVQLRTRKVRVPVPTQTQLDDARRILSSYEEQNLYDIFKMPYVLPNAGEAPEHEESAAAPAEGTKAAKQPAKGKKGKKAKGKKGSSGDEGEGEAGDFQAHVPGFKHGVPHWIEQEFQDMESMPGASSSAAGLEGLTEPYAHFEHVRDAQREWWSAEAYNRVCMLFGMVHVLQAFAYWLVIHCITDLGLVWCAAVGSTGCTAASMLIFRLDVLPSKGGCLPIELSGPFLSSIATAMMYTHSPTQFTQDVSRALAATCLVFHILFTFRMYAISKPGKDDFDSVAHESGGSKNFLVDGACDAPSWLPQSFQVVTYLIAPPQSKVDLSKEKASNDAMMMDQPVGNRNEVDMTPWYYTRTMIAVTFVGWLVLLTGRIAEAAMGERLLMTNPGVAPWTRRGLWYGWEFGPITSKHYAHVTPQRGHFGWEHGWGPQGQQELMPSDLFGFHPEADKWWSEHGKSGAANIGPNTWAKYRVNFGNVAIIDKHNGPFPETEPAVPASMASGGGGAAAVPASSGASHSAGHRRLRGEDEESVAAFEQVVRPVVPVAVQWPALFEPDLITCDAATGAIAAITINGAGAVVPSEAATGQSRGMAAAFSLAGLPKLGRASGLSWGRSGLLVVLHSGEVAECPPPGAGSQESSCRLLNLPKLPASGAVSIVEDGETYRVAIARKGDSKVTVLELVEMMWQEVAELFVESAEQTAAEVASVFASDKELHIMTKDGVAFQWSMTNGRPSSSHKREVPSAARKSEWRSHCALSSGNVVRLAATWRKAAGGAVTQQPELFL